MPNIEVSEYRWTGIENLNVEIVERKGTGHPDYIADSISEAVSRELCKYYLKRFGVILHHNVDKVLVVGGQANPVFGGGEVLQPIYIIVSGRATTYVKTKEDLEFIPVGTLIMKAAKNWIRENFRFLNPEEHVIVDYKVGQGSADLVSIFELGLKKIPLSNDTSFGVGFAPLSTLEKVVYDVERFLNSPTTKSVLPAVGEDVKVMGLRINKKIKLTIAAAIVSRFVRDKEEYLSVKEEIKEKILDFLARKVHDYDIEIFINVADKPEEGVFYLTVTGTSAEHGDDGATGRGNRVNGLITPMRPMSLEATAGKNPVSHVGKLYNVTSTIIANRIYEEVKGVKEVYVSMLSQIGRPINDPLIVDIKILPVERLTLDMINEAKNIVNEVLSKFDGITNYILENKVTLF
ncbi:methionine adenosyltransferase [Ignisphaera sp. 4213-co]|uniref:S-adenosylmethionine synthase n=1 Tax=Ignisphaera cupida TaxID=3050454 RepID=A0ABD4Z4K1_9CREN|nr:methionine adenosyltransferase [Ignisphaera sp. 4213-co]MDK6028252.1 methionine adenosyltransferase [Ignisphaera sp. 4213-co]